MFLSNHVKYLGIILIDLLKWKTHIYELSTKSNRAVSILAKFRNYVNRGALLSLYYKILQSHQLPILLHRVTVLATVNLLLTILDLRLSDIGANSCTGDEFGCLCNTSEGP